MHIFESLVTPPPDRRDGARWYVVGDGTVLLDGAGQPPTEKTIDASWLDDRAAVFLGLLDGVACWAAGATDAGSPSGSDFGDYLPVALRRLAAVVDEDEWALAGRAVQLVEWTRTHRYCGRCATPTEPLETERSLACPTCGLRAYPRLAPAVIVLVHRGDEALLAHGAGFPTQMYSAVAGFVEPGETLEHAVRREVREEVGVELAGVDYFGSQPWPFPNSLMIGFHAAWKSGDIRVDGDEISDAAWFRAAALPEIPPRMSIARRLIDHWLEHLGTAG